MNAGTGKIEINRDWYDSVDATRQAYLNGVDFFSNDPRLNDIEELTKVDRLILQGKAVLI
jgi:hypothetical protein